MGWDQLKSPVLQGYAALRGLMVLEMVLKALLAVSSFLIVQGVITGITKFTLLSRKATASRNDF